MTELFDRVKHEIEKGLSTVTIKSKEALESMKINHQIETLHEQINQALIELGQMVYAMYPQFKFDQEQITEKCTSISGLNTLLKKKEEEFYQLHIETGAALGKIYCSKCKTEIGEDSVYCKQCGEKAPEQGENV